MSDRKASIRRSQGSTGALKTTDRQRVARTAITPLVQPAKAVHRDLILLYIRASGVAVLITLFLVFCGLEFSGRQWFLMLSGVTLGIPAYVMPDIIVIGRLFRPIRKALDLIADRQPLDEKTHAEGLVRALNLPLISFLRINFVHGPLATLIVVSVLLLSNWGFDAGFLPWQFLFLTFSILFFASPAHAVYEYFAISRQMIPVVDQLWSAGGELTPEWQRRVRSIKLKNKLFYLSAFMSAVPLAFLAWSTVYKADLVLISQGVDAGFTELLPILSWAGGLVAISISLVLVIAYLLASDVTQGAADLSAAMKRVQDGHLDVELRVGGTDEYADLYLGFNHMTTELRDELRIHAITHELAGVLNLDVLISRIMNAATELLGAERSTLFLYDQDSNQLWSRFAEGMETREIRFPANAGIAGDVFESGEAANIIDAYTDPRFNQEIDRTTGFKTRNILCVPIVHKRGTRIGVAQVLNKKQGVFSSTDEARLRSFAAQISASLENARLFEDVLEMKNYSDSILRSTSDGIMTLDCDRSIVTVNAAACRILKTSERDAVGRSADDFFGSANDWVRQSIERVQSGGSSDLVMDEDFVQADHSSSVNLRSSELLDGTGTTIGFLLAFEDMTGEKRMKTTMSRYMSKEVADQLLESGSEALTGRSQMVSVLFSDIRGFTTLSEELGARETVTMLNEYFEVMVEIVHRRGGILDKYIGDAIMALFGAPFTHEADADRALHTANEMMSKLRVLNTQRACRGQVPIEIGVGICTGEVVVGNIGSSKRLDYTAIGDHVNLSSRLEGATKTYGVGILISEFTLKALKEEHPLRMIDLIRVKGKNRPVRVFEALSHQMESSGCNTWPEFLDAYKLGMQALAQQDWPLSIEHFELALSLRPQDRPAQIHLQRCRTYQANPPPADWDGVWTMTTK